MLDWLSIDPDLISNWAASLIRGSIQGGAVFALVWVMLRIQPEINPIIRCWLWRIVYLKFLISFLGIERLPIPWLSLLEILPTQLVKPFYSHPVTQWTQIVSQWVPSPQIRSNLSFDLLLFNRLKSWFILWVLGVSWFGFRLVCLWYRSRIAAKDNYPVNHPALDKLYSEFCDQLRIRKPPRLRLSGSANSPSLQGLIHPKIILPATILCQYRLAEIKLMLAHELAHFKRGDLFWNWLPAITRGLFFFHPLVWLGERQSKELPEICCDFLAVQFSGAGSADYGKVLVKAAVQSPLNLNTGLAFTGGKDSYLAGSKQTLIKRLKALDLPRPIPYKRLFVSFLALALFGLSVILPWRLFPSVFFSVKYINYYNSLYPPHLAITGNIPDIAKVYLNNFEVVIDDQKISDGITFNSFGRRFAKRFEGYLLVGNSFNPKNPHQIRVLVSTDAGDFQRNYLVDLGNNGFWANR